MADRKTKGSKKLTQLSRKRRKSPATPRPPSPRSKVRAPRPRDYRKESGAGLSGQEGTELRKILQRAPLRKLSQLRRESGAAVSRQELKDFLRRKPKGR